MFLFAGGGGGGVPARHKKFRGDNNPVIARSISRAKQREFKREFKRDISCVRCVTLQHISSRNFNSTLDLNIPLNVYFESPKPTLSLYIDLF